MIKKNIRVVIQIATQSPAHNADPESRDTHPLQTSRPNETTPAVPAATEKGSGIMGIASSAVTDRY